MFVSVQIDSARKCGRCGEFKLAADFAWRRRARGQRDNYCRACRAAYKREHYMLHHERYVTNAVQRKRALIAERAYPGGIRTRRGRSTL
jgi:hypothetical protein